MQEVANHSPKEKGKLRLLLPTAGVRLEREEIGQYSVYTSWPRITLPNHPV